MIVQIKGKFLNLATTPEKLNRQTGEVIPAKYTLQLMMKNGDKFELVNIPVKNPAEYSKYKEGDEVTAPAKVYARAQDGGFASIGVTGI